MKKAGFLAAVFSLCMALSMAVAADVAYEPGDNFYEKHFDDCVYENRTYYLNGHSGYVIGCTSPQGDAAQVFPNGGKYYVSYTYSADGESWGCIEYDPSTLENTYWDGDSCWIKMSDTVVVYDSQSFFEDHASEIESIDAALTLTGDETAVAYKYPGSGEVIGTIDVYAGNTETLSFYDGYTDSQGREWGYIGYYYGMRKLWVCLSDPTNDALAPDENCAAPQLIPAASQQVMDAAFKDAATPNYALLAGGIGVVVIAGAVLAYAVTVRRRSK